MRPLNDSLGPTLDNIAIWLFFATGIAAALMRFMRSGPILGIAIASLIAPTWIAVRAMYFTSNVQDSRWMIVAVPIAFVIGIIVASLGYVSAARLLRSRRSGGEA